MPLDVHVWSDVVCPWCFIGKRRLESAIRDFGEPVSITWHSFELDPSHQNEKLAGMTEPERLAKKYGMPVARAQEMIANMQGIGAKEGIEFARSGSKTLNSFDAHRLLHLAAKSGHQNALKERLFLAHWSEGLDCADPSVLRRLALEVGLPAADVDDLLASDAYAAEVHADQQSARELGITGVPFFVIGRYGISGAQPAATLLQVIDRAFVETSIPAPPESGDMCSTDSSC
jgi:predicted DsbA family dithiol-disulfide isomerase